jgi:hypothetical protein
VSHGGGMNETSGPDGLRLIWLHGRDIGPKGEVSERQLVMGPGASREDGGALSPRGSRLCGRRGERAIPDASCPIQPIDHRRRGPAKPAGQIGAFRVNQFEMAPTDGPGSRTRLPRHHPARPATQPSGGQPRSVKGLRPDPLRGLTDAPPPLPSRPGRGG